MNWNIPKKIGGYTFAFLLIALLISSMFEKRKSRSYNPNYGDYPDPDPTANIHNSIDTIAGNDSTYIIRTQIDTAYANHH